MDTLNWGMIGCGDVTEKKSAPSFNLIEHSNLLGLWSRNPQKTADYARRHQVPRIHGSLGELLEDDEIHAVYIATPPSSHMDYAVRAMRAGKAVYVEKPMALNARECETMIRTAEETGRSLFVAYYRRSMRYFLKVRELLQQGLLGELRYCQSNLWLPPRPEDLDPDHLPWRVLPEISGGGYFHDMGCHEIDILRFLLGEVEASAGLAVNRGGLYGAEDTVLANIRFSGGLPYSGSWCFAAPAGAEKDEILIAGEKGTLQFSCFSFAPIQLHVNGKQEKFEIAPDQPVQLPMIREVVEAIRKGSRGPCTGQDGMVVNRIMDQVTAA